MPKVPEVMVLGAASKARMLPDDARRLFFERAMN
jgi:hypothetical protein